MIQEGIDHRAQLTTPSKAPTSLRTPPPFRAPIRAPFRGHPNAPLLKSFSTLHGKIGIYGGSFDPIHHEHIAVARTCIREAGLDTVVFLPAKQNPLKESPPSSDAHRLEMLRLALAERDDMFVSDLDLKHRGPSFTVDVLEKIRQECPASTEIFFIIGSDCLADFHKWKDYRKILSLAQLLVVPRPGCPAVIPESLREAHDHLSRPPRLLFTEGNPCSSTEIRQRTKNGLSLAGLVPLPVEQYIRDEHLYSTE